MEVLILDSGYVPRSEKKQTEKGGMFLSFLALFGAVGVLAGSLVSAFSIRDERLWLLIPGIFLFSLFFSWFYADRRLDFEKNLWFSCNCDPLYGSLFCAAEQDHRRLLSDS